MANVFLVTAEFSGVPAGVSRALLIAENGQFLFRRLSVAGQVLLEAATRTGEGWPEDGLAPYTEGIRLGFAEKISGNLVQQTVAFFRAVYGQYQSEAIVLLFYAPAAPEGRRWMILPPVQRVTAGHLEADDPGSAPSGWLLAGDIHSHGNMTAFHSGTDSADEAQKDGIHVTVGGVSGPMPSFSCSVVVSGTRFQLALEDIIAGVPQVSFPSQWLERVSKPAPPPVLGMPTFSAMAKEEPSSELATSWRNQQKFTRPSGPRRGDGRKSRKRIIVVGLGGIGSALIEPLCRFLNFDDKAEWQVTLVDGDTYEEKNATRQTFGLRSMASFVKAVREYLQQDEAGLALWRQAEEAVLGFGNKAELTANRMRDMFPNVLLQAVPRFVAGPNDHIEPVFEGMTVPVADLIKDGDTVFLCVDNHKTRLTVSRHCQTLANVRLISGGNEITNGNVQLYVRRSGNDLFAPLEVVHSEIAEAASSKAPHEMSCEELAASGTPQVLFANLTAATMMLNLFWAELQRQNRAGEIYFSIQQVGTSTGPAAISFERKSTQPPSRGTHK